MRTSVPPRNPRPSAFDRAVVAATGAPLGAATIRTFQVNVGLVCNIACHHCHVVSGPKRTEEMSWETMELVLSAAKAAGASIIDITGGAPEMNPHFRRLVEAARAQGHEVMVRTNLTIALEPGYEDLLLFFLTHRVHLVASLPCYTEENVDRQRGRHVFVGSIEVLKRLNALGFGIDPDLRLDLVYNPGGPTLPSSQEALEADYRRELGERFGIRFTHLYTIANMPIGRFEDDLERSGQSEAYGALLRDTFNPETIEGLMCRHQVHVGHDGQIHDCDFNYALGMGTVGAAARHIGAFDAETFRARAIATGEHCFGCTAGRGSSCGGAITDAPR
jgi:radical SAM/Cys-rich protein